MDSLRVFEILSSHHLELYSLEAETARRKQEMKEFAGIGMVNFIRSPSCVDTQSGDFLPFSRGRILAPFPIENSDLFILTMSVIPNLRKKKKRFFFLETTRSTTYEKQ